MHEVSRYRVCVGHPREAQLVSIREVEELQVAGFSLRQSSLAQARPV